MPERQRLRLPIVAGLDRANGLLTVEPTRLRDVRDVHLQAGKARARAGLTVTISPTVAAALASDVVGIHPLRAAQLAMVAAFRRATRQVSLGTVGSSGLSYTEKAVWGTLTLDAGFPHTLGADMARRLFLAHDDPTYTARLPTKVYDGTAVGGALIGLWCYTAAGAAPNELTAVAVQPANTVPVAFRGVARWLSYIVGFGFGTAAVPDSPHTLRICLPDDVTTWRAQHYFIVGAQGEAIVAAMPVGDTLYIGKGTEVYRVVGTSMEDFGIIPVDPYFGPASSRLWVGIAGRLYFWSLEGPRVLSGDAPSEDAGLLLGLRDPEPLDLPSAGDLLDGWTYYDPTTEEAVWVFGKRAYVLHLGETPARWSYRTFGRLLASGGPVYSGVGVPFSGGLSSTPTGYPALGGLTAGVTTVSFVWVNQPGAGVIFGDEILEVWLKVGGGMWFKTLEQDAGGGALTGGALTLTAADGVVSGTAHVVGLRYRRGSEYNHAGAYDYRGSTPTDWNATAIAQSVDTVTTGAAPADPTNVHIVDGA